MLNPLATTFLLFKHSTKEPFLNFPKTLNTPTGKRLLPVLVMALAAPSSINILPLGFPKEAIHFFRDCNLSLLPLKKVPTLWPAKIRLRIFG